MDFQVLDIIEGTSVDGPGLRVSIYLAGCKHHCEGCHNPQSWNFDNGKTMTDVEILDIIKFNEMNVTLTGGDPLYNPDKIKYLCHRIKEETGSNIWCYTGFTWEEICADAKLLEAIKDIDTIVEGRFMIDKRDKSLRFRGSSNQRIINVPKSLEEQSIILANL